MSPTTHTLDEFFEGFESSRALYEPLAALIASVGPSTVSVSKSQIAFTRSRGFAWAWIPARYLRNPGAPLVLSLSLDHRDPSPRWKEIVEPAPGRFMHHLELSSEADVDAEVLEWVREAWRLA